MGKFSELESVQDHKGRALSYAVDRTKALIDGCLREADDSTKSPIEAIFKLWWAALSVNEYGIEALELSAQFQAKPINGIVYWIDFAVIPADVDFWLEGHTLGVRYQHVGLEMDGHQFHERTKEQVTGRNQRDRDLQADGWKILHFSGTELYRDPVSVVSEAVKAGLESWHAFTRAVRAKKRARGDYGK